MARLMATQQINDEQGVRGLTHVVQYSDDVCVTISLDLASHTVEVRHFRGEDANARAMSNALMSYGWGILNGRLDDSEQPLPHHDGFKRTSFGLC